MTRLLVVVVSILIASRCEARNEEGFCPTTNTQECQRSNNNIPPQSTHEQTIKDSCFKAAILEHNRVESDDVFQATQANLELYGEAARVAAEHGTNIIVFPEDGIFHANRSYMKPVLSEIPDPELLDDTNNNPCDQPELFNCDVLKKLSCIAKENHLYVVANFGTIQSCSPNSTVGDRVCPESGHFTLNTDVVLDASGNYIKRYRKYNMFIEVFDKAPSLETVYFDTPFGRFGLFTCFDMLFKSPALDLVEMHHVNTVLFPTWWYDELPLLTAIQIQDGWSWTNKVNLLASNIHRRDLASVGSGIYSGLESIYTSATATKSKLIISSLPKEYSLTSECFSSSKPLEITLETSQPESNYEPKHYQLLARDSIYTLQANEEVTTLCNGHVCCTLDYKLDSSTPLDDFKGKIVLVVRDGLRMGYFQWYEQVCVLATVETPINVEKLNETRFSMEGFAKFDRLLLRGTFNSTNVYPIAAHNLSTLINRNERAFNCDQAQSNQVSCKFEYSANSTNKTISSFGMYGRLYGSDKMPEGW